MSRTLPFTQAGLARAIKAAKLAGAVVIGIMADGTLIIGDKPVETSSLVPMEPQSSQPSSSWDDV